jgi:hypothetical protein
MEKRTNSQCLTLFASALILIPSCASAQANYVDSLKIENERSKLSTQLILLRDSMEQTIAAIEQSTKNSSPKTAEKLKALSNDLNQNKEQLDKLGKELSTISQNGWSDIKVKRIQLTEQSIRGYYKTQKKKLVRLTKQKKRTK